MRTKRGSPILLSPDWGVLFFYYWRIASPGGLLSPPVPFPLKYLKTRLYDRPGSGEKRWTFLTNPKLIMPCQPGPPNLPGTLVLFEEGKYFRPGRPNPKKTTHLFFRIFLFEIPVPPVGIFLIFLSTSESYDNNNPQYHKYYRNCKGHPRRIPF